MKLKELTPLLDMERVTISARLESMQLTGCDSIAAVTNQFGDAAVTAIETSTNGVMIIYVDAREEAQP